MSSKSLQSLSLHDLRERKKAAPQLIEEFRAILIGSSHGVSLKTFLRKKNITASLVVGEAPFDVITLGGQPNFARVTIVITDWLAGKDISTPAK